MAIAATMRPRIATNCLPVSAHQFDAAVGEDPGGRCKANSVTAVEVVVQVLIFFGVHCDNAHWLSESASANQFNESEKYLASCQNEAVHRYYKDTSSEDVRRHNYVCMIYVCMIGHGYAFKNSCTKRAGSSQTESEGR